MSTPTVSAWGVHALTYQFATSDPGTVPTGGSGFLPITAEDRVNALAAMQEWSDVADITFSPGPGMLNFARWTTGLMQGAAYGYYPSGDASGGDIWINNNYPISAAMIAHEVGHTLGLAHNTDPAARTVMMEVALPYPEIAPRYDDVLAVQSLYGANPTAFAGNTVWGWNGDTGRTWSTVTSASDGMYGAIYDTGGVDKLDFSGFTQDTVINLTPGATSTVRQTAAVDIMPGVIIENADGGSGADSITGNDVANFIRAFNGNDTVLGGGGADEINGNGGDDSMDGGSGADSVYGGQGADHVFGGDGDDPHVNGNVGADDVHGGAGNDTVYGGQDADTLYGDAGNDLLSGDLGNDILIGGTGGDWFVFVGSAGNDWIIDFNAAEGDRVQIDAGATYTITSVDGQAVAWVSTGAVIGFAGLAPDYLGNWLA